MMYRRVETALDEADYFDLPGIKELVDMWGDLPNDVKDQLTAYAKRMFQVYGPILKAFVVQAYQKMVQRKIPAIPALHLAAKQMNIPLRNATGVHPGKLTQTQVKQRKQRMDQRLPSKRSKLSFRTRGY